MTPNLLLTCLLVTGAGAGFVGDLKRDVSRALDKIKGSTEYTLLPGLTFRRAEMPETAGRDVAEIREGLLAKTEDLFRSHDLYWTFLPGVDLRIARRPRAGTFYLTVQRSLASGGNSRTFGVMRRLKLALLPIMYKLGVITTLLTMLTVFALKGLTIGVVLLVLSSAGLLAKLKHGGGHGHYADSSGWGGDLYPQVGGLHKDVHIHVHGAQHVSPPYHHHWHRSGHPDEELPSFQYSGTSAPDLISSSSSYLDPYAYYTTPKWKYIPNYNV